MSNKHFKTIEDLVFDKSFRDWILNKDEGNAQFWRDWLEENKDKHGMVKHARAIVHALSVDYHDLSDIEIGHEVERILEKIDAGTTVVPQQSALNRKRPGIVVMAMRWASAAAVIILFTISAYYLYRQEHAGIADRSFDELSLKGKPGTVEVVNQSDSIQAVQLFDSSRVLLSSGSKLVYSPNFSTRGREVYLTGEAFFIVTKNAAKPFFVYTKSIVTKVLGTSFRVKAFDNENKSSVDVQSGKVSVFRKQDLPNRAIISDKLNAFLVSRNQKVEYDAKTGQLSKMLVENPSVTTRTPSNPFVFQATPLAEVFKTMERSYGIKIMYDEDSIQKYSLSATLLDESYYEKLTIICKAIDASYEVIDGNIFITFNHRQ